MTLFTLHSGNHPWVDVAQLNDVLLQVVSLDLDPLNFLAAPEISRAQDKAKILGHPIHYQGVAELQESLGGGIAPFPLPPNPRRICEEIVRISCISPSLTKGHSLWVGAHFVHFRHARPPLGPGLRGRTWQRS
jgi:hypothetical protein